MKFYAFLLSTLFFTGIFQSCSTTNRLPRDLSDKYYGFLPCADCPGISYTLDLRPNGQYHQTMEYYERATTYDSHGKYTYENGKIKLYADEKVAGQFEFEGDNLIHLDGDGNRITTNLAPYYILYKGDPSRAEMPEELSSSGEDSPYIFKGTGNEPFWMVQVKPDGVLYFKGLMETDLEFEVPITSTDVSEDGHTTTYAGEKAGHALEVVIDHERCQDNMSGFYFPTTLQVKLTLDGKTQNLEGCGEFTGQHALNGYWKLDKLDEMDVTSSPITLFINLTDGRIAGHAGCNRYFGSIDEVTPDIVRFKGVGSTKMACPDMTLENRFLGLFSDTDIQWSIDESGQLVMTSTAGEYVFSRTGKS